MGEEFPVEVSGNSECGWGKQEVLFSTSPSCTRAAGGLSALQKNRQRTPNELFSFSLSEFRNVSEKPGCCVTSEGPGCCQTTSDQQKLRNDCLLI